GKGQGEGFAGRGGERERVADSEVMLAPEGLLHERPVAVEPRERRVRPLLPVEVVHAGDRRRVDTVDADVGTSNPAAVGSDVRGEPDARRLCGGAARRGAEGR